MKLRYIEFKNIKSFGNKLQKIDFDPDGALYQVVGKNGVGKSSFVDLPKILYYGKLDRVKKEDISNRINKYGWIHGEVEVNPTTIVNIERGICPTSLVVKKNGSDIGKSGISNYQEYIDSEVTLLPYHIFSNIVSLSINEFKSFISMTPNDKRIIIDKLFAMEIINKMYKLLRDDLKDIRMNIDLFDREMNTIKNNIDVATKELQNLKERMSEDNTRKLNKITTKLEEYKPKLEDAYKKMEIYTNKKDEINRSYNLFNQRRNKITHQIEHIEKQIKLFNQDKCPTCNTLFAEPRFGLIKEQLQSDILNKKKELSELDINEGSYKTAFKNLDDAIKIINDFILKVRSICNTLDMEFNRLKQEKPKEFESIKNIISVNNTKFIEKENERRNISVDCDYLNILESLYSDDGIKRKILESYLPLLNREIEFTLNELHFPYDLSFNSDFNVEIKHLMNNIDVENLSFGEKKKADLAVLISIMRMMKRKYPSLNIFMLDEVLSSLDSDSIYDVVGVLKNFSRELKMNIFVIHHASLPIEFFDWKIEINKINGFSDFIITNLNE